MWFPYQRDSGQLKRAVRSINNWLVLSPLIAAGLRFVVGWEGILYGSFIGLVLGTMGGAPPLEAKLFSKWIEKGDSFYREIRIEKRNPR